MALFAPEMTGRKVCTTFIFGEFVVKELIGLSKIECNTQP